MCQFSTTDRSRVRLNKDLGVYDRETIYQIIDEAPYCHLSTVIDNTPYIQPTVHWRNGDQLYIHGAVKNKMVKALAGGAEAALAFSHFDGYVLTRSAINHSALYRSVVAFSTARVVEDLEEKNEALRLLVERVQPGRWQQVRQPTTEELKMTGVLALELTEVSAKIIPQAMASIILPGGELEAAADAEIDAWTGIFPYKLVEGEPIAS